MQERDESVEEVLEEEVDDIEPDDGGDDEESDEEVESETAVETAERIIRESKEKTPKSDESEEASRTDESVQEVDNTPAKRGRPKKGDEIEPPPYLSLEDKEIFNKLPLAGRRLLKDTLTRHQARFTENSTKTAQAEKESKEYNEVARDYLYKHPELVEKGYTGPRLLRELLGTHMVLTGENRTTAKNRWLKMGQDLGFDLSAEQGQEGGSFDVSKIDISQHPQFQALQQEVNTTKLERERAYQERVQNIASQIEGQIVSVQNEKRADGSYLYPETHDGNFLKQVQPVVSAFARTMPYSEALKRAVLAQREDFWNGNFSQGNQATLPARNNNQVNRQAASAAVSVRGNTNAPNNGQTVDIPKSALASATDTAAWIIRNGRGG